MKPFNLEQAKAGKPVVTRDGRKARIVCFDKKHPTYPIVALIASRDSGTEQAINFTNNGNGCNGGEGSTDLFMAPETVTGWVVLLKNKKGIYPSGYVYNSEEEAKAQFSMFQNFVATVKIQFEV